MTTEKVNLTNQQEANTGGIDIIPEEEVITASVQETELNEADGELIFHAPDEEGDDDNE